MVGWVTMCLFNHYCMRYDDGLLWVCYLRVTWCSLPPLSPTHPPTQLAIPSPPSPLPHRRISLCHKTNDKRRAMLRPPISSAFWLIFFSMTGFDLVVVAAVVVLRLTSVFLWIVSQLLKMNARVRLLFSSSRSLLAQSVMIHWKPGSISQLQLQLQVTNWCRCDTGYSTSLNIPPQKQASVSFFNLKVELNKIIGLHIIRRSVCVCVCVYV